MSSGSSESPVAESHHRPHRVIIFRVVAVLAGRFFVVAVVLVASAPWAMRICWPRSSGWIGRITAGSPVTARSPNTSRSRPAPIKTMIWSRMRQVNTLRSLLRGVLPGCPGRSGQTSRAATHWRCSPWHPAQSWAAGCPNCVSKPCCGVPVGRLGKELQVFLTLGADPVLSLLESGSVPEYSREATSAEPDRQPSRLEPHPPRPVVLVRIPHPPPLTARESLGPDIGTARRAACAISFPATDFAARRNNVAARRSRNMELVENSGSSRMNFHIDTEPRSPTAAAPRESELPQLTLAEFRTGVHCGLSSDLETSAPAGITHEVTS